MDDINISEINNLIKNNKFKNHFIKSILLALEPQYKLYDSKVQNEFTHYFKKKLKEDLMEKNLYLNFDNKLKLKKNDIYLDLNSQNFEINEYTKQYISYYFNINIIIINQSTKKHRCIIKYNPDWYTIILINDKNNYIPLILDDLLTNDDTQIILNYFKEDELFIFRNETDISIQEKEKISKLNKLKINELKDIAFEYDIDIYKVSSSNNKNKLKTKQELCEEIKNYIINN